MTSRKPIRKAVFPVAGLGTRFLPATKAIPKELLPIVDRPLIQYAVDEAREAGIEQMIFVTGRGKTAIVEHFDVAFELETTMGERGKDMTALDATRATPGDIITVRQQVPLGLGHAIWCARAIVGDEPFAILLPDELMIAQTIMKAMNPPTKPQLPMMLRMRSAARWPIVRWAVWSACQSRGACVLVMR